MLFVGGESDRMSPGENPSAERNSRGDDLGAARLVVGASSGGEDAVDDVVARVVRPEGVCRAATPRRVASARQGGAVVTRCTIGFTPPTGIPAKYDGARNPMVGTPAPRVRRIVAMT